MKSTLNNPVFSELCKLQICNIDEIDLFHRGVRDRDDIDVLRCKRTGALFLNRTDHMDISHYNEKSPTHRYGAEKRAIITSNDDTQRRYTRHVNTVRGRKWLDIGAGSGAMLDTLGPLSASYAGVEPQIQAAQFLQSIGHQVYSTVDAIPENEIYEVVTFFHVFEHLLSPVAILKELHRFLAQDGVLIIEVPHARDALITLMHNQEFCSHTFWSEHLFLHTRKTLECLVSYAGFEVTAIQGIQRYPVANHLHWLSRGKPGGHVQWNFLRDQSLDASYENLLARLDITDTLILEARKK